MTPKKLIFIDAFISFPLKFFALFFKYINSFRSNNNSNLILIVKFLGAGNYISISHILNKSNYHVVTVKSNRNTLDKFAISAKLFLIDERSFLTLFLTSFILFFKLCFRKYETVVNLESESAFAKLITSIPASNNILGISNKHKSLFDNLFYSSYLVSPNLLSKPNTLNLLLNFSQITNQEVSDLINSHNNQFLLNCSNYDVNSISIAPTCSKTDNNRRISSELWKQIVKKINSKIKITILFQDQKDSQYQSFKEISKEFNNIQIKICNYEQFVKSIKESCMLFTLDSQALHVAQKIGKPSIAFYGPTSPYGVELKETTYVISRSLVCSPCVHKYLNLPCKDKNYCMHFDINDLEHALKELIFLK